MNSAVPPCLLLSQPLKIRRANTLPAINAGMRQNILGTRILRMLFLLPSAAHFLPRSSFHFQPWVELSVDAPAVLSPLHRFKHMIN